MQTRKPESENLSALIDGEVDPQTLLAALDRLDADPGQADDAAIFALIGDALRAGTHKSDASLSVNVTASVMAAVAREPIPTAVRPADNNVMPFSGRHLVKAWPGTWKNVASALGGVAATLFVSAVVWSTSPVAQDPQSASAFFEQPAQQQRVVTMDAMPADMVDYLLAHRQNSAAGSMNAGSALIRANLGTDGVAVERRAPPPRGSDMEWVRLWDSKPAYISSSAVER